MAVQFGVVEDSGTYGVVQSVEIENTCDVETYLDADGDVAGYDASNVQAKISMDFIYDSTKAAPTVGTTITINSVKYLATSVKQIEENKGFRKVQIEGIRYVTNSLPAA